MTQNLLYCRPTIAESPPSKGLNIWIPSIKPIEGRGFINHGSTLPASCPVFSFWVRALGRLVETCRTSSFRVDFQVAVSYLGLGV